MRTTTVVIGAGHAGLAIGHFLAASSIDHVLIERGEVANSWRTERWDALRLLTPNWQARVPGLAYDGDDPDGFMDMAEVVAFIERYARLVDPPLQTRTTVESVRPNSNGYEVATDRGTWHAPTVVLATGGCNLPKVPPFAADLPGSVESLTPMQYTRASELPHGPALRGGRIGHRGPDRRRGPRLGAPGDPRRRRARTHATHLPGSGHPVVDGPHGPPRRTGTTRWMTFGGREGSPHPSSSGNPTGPPWT